MQKSYYAIIPATVRYDKKLTGSAKLLYGEITALCNEKGYCWASDSYFSDLYEVSKSTIQRWFKQLEDTGYIKRKIIYEEGTLKIKHRYTYLCDNPIPINETTPIPKNEGDNNTVINTTFNNTRDKDIVGKPDIPYKEIIDYLNGTANKKYRHTTHATKKKIKERWNEGFRLDDFKKVIDVKNAEWKDSPKWSKFIRPDTLFGPKFEGYLNQDAPRPPGYDPNKDAF